MRKGCPALILLLLASSCTRGTGSHSSITGHWVGPVTMPPIGAVVDTLYCPLDVQLNEAADDSTTGTGVLCGYPAVINGSHRRDSVLLSIDQTITSTISFAGILAHRDTIVGTLSGHGFRGTYAKLGRRP